MNFVHSKYFIPFLHVLVWSLLLLIPAILFHRDNLLGLSQAFFVVTSIYHIGLFYFNAYFLYPKLLTKRWWWLYLICIAAIIIISFRIKIMVLRLNPGFVLTEDNRRIIFFALIPILIASIIFRLISDRLRSERIEKEARTQRLDSELKFLRSQISPHFLFNMMSNMVALARQKSDLLEPSLIKLSDLLRYMLYDSAEEKIKMSTEAENVRNYVALQQLRFGEDVSLQADIRQPSPDCLVEPMLLVPFIENAFKHGVGIAGGSMISISLQVENQALSFQVTNRIDSTIQSSDKNHGIGIANVENRLRLLYPGKYQLLIDNTGNMFSVRLNLDLS